MLKCISKLVLTMLVAGFSVSALAGEINALKLIDLPVVSFANLLKQTEVRSDTIIDSAKPISKILSVAELIETPPVLAGNLFDLSATIKKPIKEKEPISVIDTIIAKAPESVPEAIVTPILKNTLRISMAAGKILFEPKKLVINELNKIIDVEFEGDLNASIYVRDHKIIDWNFKEKQIRSLAKGDTELYVVAGDKIHILTVAVDGSKIELDMSVPDSLVSLDGVFNKNVNSALFPSAAAAAAATDSQNDNLEISRSKQQTEDSIESREEETKQNNTEVLNYRDVNLQLIDERSIVEAGKIYPVSGAMVRIVGTEFSGTTDVTGHITIPDMPENSQFLVAVDDPSGFTYPASFEVNTQTTEKLERKTLVRTMAFEATSSIAGAVQDASLGSLCINLLDRSRGDTPIQEAEVSIDIESEGPYYFNRFGYLDLSMAATGKDGRVCYFNIPSGPVAVSLSYQGSEFALVPIGVIAGRHIEEVINLDEGLRFTTLIAAAPTAHVQLGVNIEYANSLRPIDVIDLVVFGQPDPMALIEDGQLATHAPVFGNNGRLFAMSQAPEFEPVVYTYNIYSDNHTTTLYPRGFLEDMSLFAQTTVELGRGSIVAEHSPMVGQEDGIVDILVYDQFNRQLSEGWVYQDSPTSKVIYFNLSPGIYQLISKTEDGYWVGAKTVYVYSDTITHARTGSLSPVIK
jgi:hypothetical protein